MTFLRFPLNAVVFLFIFFGQILLARDGQVKALSGDAVTRCKIVFSSGKEFDAIVQEAVDFIEDYTGYDGASSEESNFRRVVLSPMPSPEIAPLDLDGNLCINAPKYIRAVNAWLDWKYSLGGS